MLASSLKLEYPLNDSLPSTEHSRDRLLAKIHAHRNDAKGGDQASEEDMALLYIYGRSPHVPRKYRSTDMAISGQCW